MTKCSDCFVTGEAVYVVTGDAVHSGVGAAEHFMAGGTACLVAGAVACFGGTFLVALFAYHNHNLLSVLPHFCKWGNVVPMNKVLQPV